MTLETLEQELHKEFVETYEGIKELNHQNVMILGCISATLNYICHLRDQHDKHLVKSNTSHLQETLGGTNAVK